LLSTSLKPFSGTDANIDSGFSLSMTPDISSVVDPRPDLQTTLLWKLLTEVCPNCPLKATPPSRH
jgi:hypothetical protein